MHDYEKLFIVVLQLRLLAGIEYVLKGQIVQVEPLSEVLQDVRRDIALNIDPGRRLGIEPGNHVDRVAEYSFRVVRIRVSDEADAQRHRRIGSHQRTRRRSGRMIAFRKCVHRACGAARALQSSPSEAAPRPRAYSGRAPIRTAANPSTIGISHSASAMR